MLNFNIWYFLFTMTILILIGIFILFLINNSFCLTYLWLQIHKTTRHFIVSTKEKISSKKKKNYKINPQLDASSTIPVLLPDQVLIKVKFFYFN